MFVKAHYSLKTVIDGMVPSARRKLPLLHTTHLMGKFFSRNFFVISSLDSSDWCSINLNGVHSKICYRSRPLKYPLVGKFNFAYNPILSNRYKRENQGDFSIVQAATVSIVSLKRH